MVRAAPCKHMVRVAPCKPVSTENISTSRWVENTSKAVIIQIVKNDLVVWVHLTDYPPLVLQER